jgi:UDP-N-acetylglucosamine 4,6-dehydratase/5-epimerase
VVCLSTDKAAYPVNAMGTSKAMMEKIFVAKSRTVPADQTLICGTRYGNVMCSRGSVIPLFISQIKKGTPITVTDPNMTRFIMSLEEAVELVMYAFQHAKTGDILVRKSPACATGVLAEAIKHMFKREDHPVQIIGVRHGEKIFETLLTNEECMQAIDMGDYYRVPSDTRDLNYDKYFVEGSAKQSNLTEFNSSNTTLLTEDDVIQKLMKLQYIQNELSDWA